MSTHKRTKLTLKALVATPDRYGRMRFLLLDELNDGKKDYSASVITRYMGKDMAGPFKMWPADDNVVGEFWVVVPKGRQKHWSAIYTPLRGREVSVEVKPRRYAFIAGDVKREGVTFDLVDISPLAKELPAEKKSR